MILSIHRIDRLDQHDHACFLLEFEELMKRYKLTFQEVT